MSCIDTQQNNRALAQTIICKRWAKAPNYAYSQQRPKGRC